MTTIKDILAMPLEQGTGGYELTVKVAKKAWDVAGVWYQRLMLCDGEDEILAEVTLHGVNNRIMRNTPIRIIVARRTTRDVNNVNVPCLKIQEWADASPVMSEPMSMATDAEEWYAARQEEIRGKCRYGVVCAMIERRDSLARVMEQKFDVNDVVDFIMTGK